MSLELCTGADWHTFNSTRSFPAGSMSLRVDGLPVVQPIEVLPCSALWSQEHMLVLWHHNATTSLQSTDLLRAQPAGRGVDF